MSKHERQHGLSHVENSTMSEAKRPRLVNMNTNYSTSLNKDEKSSTFSTCFLTDKLLTPDEKKPLE